VLIDDVLLTVTFVEPLTIHAVTVEVTVVYVGVCVGEAVGAVVGALVGEGVGLLLL
jgi:hypothetical protein